MASARVRATLPPPAVIKLLTELYNLRVHIAALECYPRSVQSTPSEGEKRRKRERKKEKALIANNQFDQSNKKANEGSRNWFGRRKKVKTQSYQDSKKLVPSKTFQQAVDDNGKNINNELEIINRPGTQNAPQGMSIDDVKRLLGN